jgi:hypothetical protein
VLLLLLAGAAVAAAATLDHWLGEQNCDSDACTPCLFNKHNFRLNCCPTIHLLLLLMLPQPLLQQRSELQPLQRQPIPQHAYHMRLITTAAHQTCCCCSRRVDIHCCCCHKPAARMHSATADAAATQSPVNCRCTPNLVIPLLLLLLLLLTAS